MSARILLASTAAILGAVAVGPAEAAPTVLGSFKQWNAYTSAEDGKMCFIAAQPSDSKYDPKPPSKRDPVFFMVTIIPAKKIVNEASTKIGYPFKEASKVTVSVDTNQFTMFTDQDTAWIEDPAQENALLDAMRKGTKMMVKGTSRRGTTTTDSYSLSGVSAALEAIAKECPGAAAAATQ
jgi:hypothetical protein